MLSLPPTYLYSSVTYLATLAPTHMAVGCTYVGTYVWRAATGTNVWLWKSPLCCCPPLSFPSPAAKLALSSRIQKTERVRSFATYLIYTNSAQ